MPHASEMHFQKLVSGDSVPSIQGRIFCSSRDPQKEAQAWILHQKISELDSQSSICLLGLGAGFHLNLLLEKTNRPFFHVIEQHDLLIDMWQSQNPQFLSRVQFSKSFESPSCPVLEFRPSWSGNEKFYHELSQKLRQATAKYLQLEAQQRGLSELSLALGAHLQSNFELTVKDIVQLFPIENQTEEARLWRTLREFVK